MADLSVAAANQVDQWSSNILTEWVREQMFARYMGTDENKVIQVDEKLESNPGDEVTISMLGRVTGNGVTGDNTLEGNEVAPSNYGYKITVNQIRQAVRAGRMEQKKTHIQLLQKYKPALKAWRMSYFRDRIIERLYCPVVDGTTTYGSASEAQKDAWLAANSDRVLFGAAKSNNAANDHSAALLNVDATADVLSPGILSLAKRMARTADPSIRPIMIKGGEEWFVYFADSLSFRDLKNNSTIIQANREARERGVDNPLFAGGDLLWDGIVIHEVPEIPVVSGVGAAAIDVAAGFLCGAQALGFAWGERTHAIEDTTDYGNKRGAGIAEISGTAKLIYNSIQHGMVTVYTAAVADT